MSSITYALTAMEAAANLTDEELSFLLTGPELDQPKHFRDYQLIRGAYF